MFTRLLTSQVKTRLARVPAVAILGPRQIGKTTLALKIAEKKSSIYLDLEAPSDLAKLQDPTAYFNSHSKELVILDEIQRTPELFKILRGIIDKGRQGGKKNGRFLILGSASQDLLKQSSESLAGRITYLELTGLTPLEVGAVSVHDLNKLWFRGGFPESYTASSNQLSAQWREDFIRTYLERDIPQLGPHIPALTLRRFWTMLAHLQASMINISKLATNFGLSHTTIGRYLDLLVDLLLVRRLLPWHINTRKRLVKSPKIYVRDSGLVHQLLNIATFDGLLSHPVVGASWEGFVIENLLSVAPFHTDAHFYRTSGGAEIDLLLHLPDQKCWAIEIKQTTVPKIKHGFYQGCEDVAPTHRFVIYHGTEKFPLPHHVYAISLPELMAELRKVFT